MSGTVIHPTALIEPGAELGEDVRIGPFCHVASSARLGDRVELKSHVSVLEGTTIGAGTVVWPYATLGGDPQNRGHKGGPTTLVIGENCTIREGVTMNRGSDNSRGTTIVGDRGYFMAYAHVAHDCIVGNDVTLANQATLGGHCEVGDHVNIGGLAAVHQFVRIGHHAFVGGCSGLVGDLIPFGMAQGSRARLRGLNVVGMRRSGLSAERIRRLRTAYRQIFSGNDTMAANAAAVRQAMAEDELVVEMVDFLLVRGRRHLCVPVPAGADSDDDGAEG